MLEVLLVLDTIEEYSKYKTIVSKHVTDFDMNRILTGIDSYYGETSNKAISWPDFAVWFFAKNPMIKEEKKLLFDGAFKKLETSLLSSTLRSDLIKLFLERYHAERISFMAMEIAEGKKSDLTKVQTELDQYLTTSGKASTIEAEATPMDINALVETMTHLSGLNWRMDAFNTSLGPLRKGNFCLFAARPEVGKTTLLCSEATYMAPQLQDDEVVLYFTNEEGEAPVKQRIVCAALGITYGTLVKNVAYYTNEYRKLMNGNMDKIIVIDKHNLHVRDIEFWLNKEKAGLVCIDQLRKVQGFDEINGGVQRLERLFQNAREWSKEFAPILTVGQLDAQADDEQYPPMGRLYESKTAVQGECDVIVNIGKVDGSVPQNARWLNIVKNKLPTPGDPEFRHAKHEVRIMADYGRFK